MKRFYGVIDPDGTRRVLVQQLGKKRPLSLYLSVRNHSPTGFNWGYGGSGPAQLALALLCNVLRDRERAEKLYQHFKWKVIAPLPQDREWNYSDQFIRISAEVLELELAAEVEEQHA